MSSRPGEGKGTATTGETREINQVPRKRSHGVVAAFYLTFPSQVLPAHPDVPQF